MKRPCLLNLLIGTLFSFASVTGPPVAGAQTPAQAPVGTTKPLIDQLKDSDAKVRAKAAREIGKSAEASTVPALAAALTDTSGDVRHEVVIALSKIHTPQALDALTTATRDSDPDVRVTAVQGLVGYYTGQEPETGFTGFVLKEYRRAKSRFVTENTRIDPGIAVDPKPIAALIAAMRDVLSIKAAREAAKGLGILVAQSAVPALVEAAHSPDEDLAREALNSLSKINDKSAGPQLVNLLNSPLKEVKRDAAVTVGVLRTHEALTKLQAMFEADPDQKNKERALEGLAYLGEPVSVPIFSTALWSEDKTMRASAAEGMARAADPKALPDLEKAIAAEKDAAVTLAIEYALTALGKKEFLSPLVQELGSKIHGNAAQAYLIELSRDPRFLPKLYPYLSNKDATVRKRLCTVLMFTGSQASLDQLERLSQDPNGDVASEALRALRAIRVRSSAAAK
jgi:HEAT repeat protein